MPAVHLELRHAGRATSHDVSESGFVLGSVPGCDLRLPGGGLPPVIAIITRTTSGVTLRKLAPVLPLLVNGSAVTSASLREGDRITVGTVDLVVRIRGVTPAIDTPLSPDLLDRARQLAGLQQQLAEQRKELEADRGAWEQRRIEIERECRQRIETVTALSQQAQQQQQELTAARADLQSRETATREAHALINRERDALVARVAELEKQEKDLLAARQEFATLRKQFHERYRHRRDRVASLHQSVRKAARKLQARKREFDVLAAELEQRRKEDEARQRELTALAEELTRERHRLEEHEEQIEAHRIKAGEEIARRQAEFEEREQQLLREAAALEQGKTDHSSTILRLDRLQAGIEAKQKQTEERAAEVERRFEQLEQATQELEEQAKQLDDWHARLTAEEAQLEQRKAEQAALVADAAQRTAALEGQQAMLASLRTRLERMREEVRREEQHLAEQRAVQEAAQTELQQRLAEVQKLRADLDADLLMQQQERQRFAEREKVLAEAVANLRQSQDALAAEQAEVARQKAELEATRTAHTEQADLVRGRGEELARLQDRLLAEQQAIRERDTALAQAEKTLAALQEQLRRRGEEINARQRQQEEQSRRHAEALASLEAEHEVSEQARREAEERLSTLRATLDTRGQELEGRAMELVSKEEAVRQQLEAAAAEMRRVEEEREVLARERRLWETEHRAAVEGAERERAEIDTLKREVQEALAQLPDLELRAQAATERLAQTREQFREHLGEVNGYAVETRRDLELLQARVQAEAERVRQQEIELHRARDEHRLAVAGFRQQLIEWQGRVAELKRFLAQGETRLGQREAAIAEQLRQVDETSARLAEEAERLQEQEREVQERHTEVTRHLDDMRQWYRTKLRELAGADGEIEPEENAEGPSILSLTNEVDPGDRQLGDLLRSLELVDADTLTRLLVEARRQRRSLRQSLLAGGYLTLYQIALIEAGNLDGLVLGPVRVIDRLRATPQEVVYRVFDPRRSQEAVLRHLAEAEMQSAVHPDEFRQRFAAAAGLRHPHIAATWEVLDIHDRPAVLQEWLCGLPSNDWPALAAVPGVWFRLLCQAALALQKVQEAGLSHGHLQAGSFVLTSDGLVKLCGLGEPEWLVPADSEEEGQPPPAEDDLVALGRVASGWAAITPLRKSAKTKPLPEGLQNVLRRLTSESAEERYSSAAALLEDLDHAGADVPPNAAAWDRLLRQVREHVSANQVAA